MLQNYLISSFRNILKNPLFSLINIGGLAVGLAVCLMVYLYVDREMNYDNWIKDSDTIYHVEMVFQTDTSGTVYMNNGIVPARYEMEAKVPEIDASTMFDYNRRSLKRDDTVFFERIIAVNENFY